MSKAAPAKVATAAPSIAAHTRDKNIDLALSAITKQFGEGSIMRLGSNQHMKVETLSTGSLAIDLALGVGGLPKGRIIEIYGPESSGKTTFCLSVIAEAQKKGGLAALIDVIILDSVAALTTRAELDGQMGDATVGAQARLMSQAMRRLTAVVSKTQ